LLLLCCQIESNTHTHTYTLAFGTQTNTTNDVRVNNMRPLLPPAILSEELPVSDEVADSVSAARAAISKAITGEDDRLVSE
jgi:3-deoxy-7-phosphoheptulonate synthase